MALPRLLAGVGVAAVIAVTAHPAGAGAAPAPYLYVGGANCSDSGAGTQAQPYCSVVQAGTAVQAGQTVLVSAGTYAGGVKITHSGTAAAPIVVQAATGAAVVITGGANGFAVSSRQYVSITGFTVTGTSGVGIYLSGSSNITVSYNDVSQSGRPASGAIAAGIYLNGTSNSLITHNSSHHNTDHGIKITGSAATGNTISYNEVDYNARQYERAANGIYNTSPGNVFIGNRLHHNEDSGLYQTNGGDNSLIVDNAAYENGDHGVDNLNVNGGTIVGNTVYRNCTDGINVEGTSNNFLLRNNVAVDNAVYVVNPTPMQFSNTCKRRVGNIGIYDSAPPTTTVDSNLVWLTTAGTMYTFGSQYRSLAALQAATGQEAHGIQADPRFVDPANDTLQLAAGSPAIDSADATATGEPTADLLGNPRVDDAATPNTGLGARPYDDRGAYEFGSTPASAPGAPAALTAAAGDGSVVLSWAAPASDGGSPILAYRIYRGTAAGGEGSTPVATVAAGTAFTDAGLTNGTTYFYDVTAVNAIGESSPGGEASATPAAPLTAPSAPRSPSASAGDASVTLSWTPPANSGGSAVTGYRVYRGTSAGGESPVPVGSPTGSTFVDTGLTDGTTYYYAISAVNNSGESPLSPEVSGTPTAAAAPSAPAAPTVTSGDQYVRLSWTAPAANGSPITGYDIYRSTSSGGEGSTPIAGPVTGTSFVDSGLTDGTPYFYRVTAVNAVGESTPSPEVSGTPVAPAPAPAYVKRLGSGASTSARSSLTVTIPAGGVAAGHTIVASALLYSTATSGAVSATDSAGDTYRLVTDLNDGTTNRTVALVATNVSALPGGAVLTLTFPSAAKQTWSIDEFSGPTSVDATAGARGSTAAFSSGAQPAQAGELLIGVLGGKATATPAFDAGWTALPSTVVSSSWYLTVAYQPAGAAGSYAATGTTSGPWMAGLAALR